MNLDRFNLNLFVAFEALSNADTLTQAAGALYVTQSTLSVALRQMREYFDDELFVYKPKQKELTPLAQNLRPHVLEVLKTAKATLMLKVETSKFAGESRSTEEIPLVAASVKPESRALERQGLARGAFANAKSQSHIQRRPPKYRLLAELDRGR